jgi:hypothetical protein
MQENFLGSFGACGLSGLTGTWDILGEARRRDVRFGLVGFSNDLIPMHGRVASPVHMPILGDHP